MPFRALTANINGQDIHFDVVDYALLFDDAGDLTGIRVQYEQTMPSGRRNRDEITLDRDAHLGTIPPGLLTALTTVESRIIIGLENALGS